MTELDLTEELRQMAQLRQARICRRRQERADLAEARKIGLAARHRRRLHLIHQTSAGRSGGEQERSMTTRHVAIDLDGSGKGTIQLDGQDISYAVSGTEVSSDAGRITELTLHLLCPRLELNAEVQVAIPEHTRQLLVHLGWKPPDE